MSIVAKILRENLDDGFVRSSTMIVASEIGDKTFFIAAVMAMTEKRVEVWSGSVVALAIMTALSAILGAIAPNVLNKEMTHYGAVVLFFVFGLRSVYDCTIGFDANAESELHEVEKELRLSNNEQRRKTRSSARASTQKTTSSNSEKKNAKRSTTKIGDMFAKFLSPVFVKAFLLTFLAEWGDRSQIATIALAADYNPIGVTFGGILGHAICTSLAVLGGKKMAGAISERMVGLCGGFLFLAFGAHALYIGE